MSIFNTFSKASFLLLSFSLIWFRLQAQPGTNDNSFNLLDNGTFGTSTGINNHVFASAIQNDGKIIVGGAFLSINGVPRNRIARLNQDGSLDASFVVGSGFSSTVYALDIQSDGKILVGGIFSTYNGQSSPGMIRLNTDGSRDMDFSVGSGFNSWVRTIKTLSDGKILVGGEFTQYNSSPQPYLVKLNSDGSLDNLFDVGTSLGGIPWPHIWSLDIQSDGKIVIGGSFTSFNGISLNNIARLETNGTLDNSFNIGSGFTGQLKKVLIQPDGKILVGGGFSAYGDQEILYLARLNSSGSIDASFNSGNQFGEGLNFWVNDIALQMGGEIIAVGNFSTVNGLSRNRVVRLDTSGNLDLTFNPATGFDDEAHTAHVLDDGDMLVTGKFKFFNGINRSYVAKLNDVGQLIMPFNQGSGISNWFSPKVSALAIQSDGKTIIGGDFTTYNGSPRFNIARINIDGTLDETFTVNQGFNNAVRALAIQADGKIVVGGVFTSYNGTELGRIARLNPDGSLDNSFNSVLSHIGFGNIVNSLVIQPDGKIIVGGNFLTFNGVSRNRILRLNSDGTLDTDFNPGFGCNQEVWSLALQNDGKIMVGGNFTIFNQQPRNRLVRLNSDGTLDLDFNIGNGCSGIVRSIAVQDDGKIIAGGEFTFYNSIGSNRIVRLNSNGSLDLTFDIGTGFNNVVQSILIEPSGNIVAGGNFSLYNQNSSIRIVRLTENGLFDASFETGDGFNAFVNVVQLQNDGKMLVGGEFTTYNNIPRNRLARLNGNQVCDVIEGADIINSCAPITWIDGNTYSSSNNTATFLLEGAAQNGCDSLVTLNLAMWACTQLRAIDCGATNITLDEPLRAINVNAPAYRFRVTGANNGGPGWVAGSFVHDSPNRAFKFAFIPGSIWGETYGVQVAVGDGLGNFGPYGASCNVTLVGMPTTQLDAVDCGATNVDPNTNLLAIKVTGSTGYRFLVNGLGVVANTVVEKTMGGGAMRKLKMNEVAGILQGEIYTVEVAIRDAAGNWGAYGTACNVTLFGIPELVINNDGEIFIDNKTTTLVEFGANASHNPFTTEFGLQVLNANDQEPIAISIYDMSGKLIERHAVNPMDIENAKFGSNLASGMYMIEVRQGSNQAVIRQVKN